MAMLENRRSKYGTTSIWECRCDCGGISVVSRRDLSTGNTKSCGCLHRDTMRGILTKHGHNPKGKRTRTYSSWSSMKARCLNPNNPNYFNYGGRGIKVCKRWMSFDNFLNDMGECPAGLTIERVRNNSGYRKSNCKWDTERAQSRNTRRNIRIRFDGRVQVLKDWARESGLSYGTLYSRVKYLGWEFSKAISTPPRN